MERLTGVYEGRIVSLGNGNATAFVPQVFGDITIVISSFLGPYSAGPGWVIFQAGDPEFPVWMSGAFGESVASSGVSGFTYTQDTDPETPTHGQTWFNTVLGFSYVWVDDGSSQQWVQFAPGPRSGSGTEASKTSSPPAGTRYFATDTKRDWLYDGTGWIIMAEPEQSYVTAFGGTSQGNGTLTGSYQRSNGWVEFTATFVLGSTSGVSGGGYAIMPFPAKRAMYDAIKVAYNDSGNLIYSGMTYIFGAGDNRCNLYVVDTSGTYGKIGVYGAVVPFTWGVGDMMHVSGRYPMQNLYT